MRTDRKNLVFLLIFAFLFGFLFSCNEKNKRISETEDTDDFYDIDAKGIPQFAGVDYIELAKISRISKFRSGIGHDYSDDFEQCRSMKHYYMPISTKTSLYFECENRKTSKK